MKAMILAAGHGQRMRPLTINTPKPLLHYGESRLIEYQIRSLRKAGITELVINICCHPEQFQEVLGDGRQYDVSIQYSIEAPQPFGTGGGIFNALPLLGDDPFIVVSADIWTDFPYQTLVQKSLDIDAHLVMVDNPDFHPQGDFCLQDNGLLSLDDDKLTYANIALLHPRLFADCNPDSFPLAPLFVKAIQQQRISGEHYTGEWQNIGTPGQLKLAKASAQPRADV